MNSSPNSCIREDIHCNEAIIMEREGRAMEGMQLEQVAQGILNGRTLSVRLGTRLQVQLGEGEACIKILSSLVGIIPETALILQFPDTPDILERLTELSPVIIRYIHDGDVYGFSSTIISSTHKPVFLVYIAYPVSIEVMNLRKTNRLECLLPAELKISIPGVERAAIFSGVILDISTGGCRLYVEYGAPLNEFPNIGIGQYVDIRFHLPGNNEEQAISCKIRNLKKDAGRAQLGLKFDENNSAVLKNIGTYLEGFPRMQLLLLHSTS